MRSEKSLRQDRRKAWIAGIVVFGVVAGLPLSMFVAFVLSGGASD